MEVKPKKTPEFRLPVTTKPNKQRQGLNLYGRALYSDGQRSETMAGSYPHRPSFLFFPGQGFTAGNKPGAVKGFEFREKLIGLKKKKQLQHSRPGWWSLAVSWAVVTSGWSTMAPISSRIACRPREGQRWNCLWSPGARVGHTFGSWNKSFYTH